VAGVHLDAREAWRVFWSHRLDRVIAGGIRVTCLDDAGVLLVLALHAGADPHQHPRALNDLEAAAAKFDVEHWRPVEALARELSALDFLASGLLLVPAGVSLVETLGLASSVSARSLLRSQRPPPLALGLDRLAATPGLWSKVRIIARELVPTPDGMRYWLVSVNGSQRSLAWGYAYRPLHLLTRMPDAVAAVARARRAARRARRQADRQV
jgi:hypothetical protein